MDFCLHKCNRMTLFLWTWCLCLIFLCVPCGSADNKSGECVTENSCRCSFISGLAIDLSVLGSKQDWLQVPVAPNSTLYFHPCSDLKLGPEGSECASGVSVCLLNWTTGRYEALGSANESLFLSEGGLYSAKYLQYKHNTRLTTFGLNCDTESKDVSKTKLSVSPGNTEDNNHLKLELTSAAACVGYVSELDVTAGDEAGDGGLSTGSLLVILFFVFTAVYFVGGALALRFLRGARGFEMVPNSAFWTELPELVKDGIHFTLSGCRPVPGTVYDSI